MRNSYSEAQQEWLRNNYPKLGSACTKKFNEKFGCAKKPSSLAKHCRDLGLKAPSDGRLQKFYTSEMERWLKENHEKYLRCDLAKEFNKVFGTNITKGGIQAKLKSMGLKVNKKEHYKKFGKEISQKISKAQDDRLEIGSEKKYDNGFIYVKVKSGAGKKNFRLKHYVVWEQAHNMKVPKGSQVLFLDGNKENFDIDNLALVDVHVACILRAYNANARGEFTKKAIEYISVENEIRKIIGYKRRGRK